MRARRRIEMCKEQESCCGRSKSFDEIRVRREIRAYGLLGRPAYPRDSK